MIEKNKFNNHIASIKESLIKDRLVVFCGAGVSKDSGIPLWFELEQGIKNRLDEDTRETDALKIAQMLYNEKGEKEYNDIIKELLFKNSTKYNLLHETLVRLNPQHIVTTNYDSFFEDVIRDEGLAYSLVSKDEHLPYAEHKKLLIKYHGDFENHNIVLKESDYLEYSQNNTLKEVFVKSLFSNKTILFVGYSVSDPNLKLLIRELQNILKKHYQRAYLLTAKNDVSDSEVRYFENLGINIVVQDSSVPSIPETKENKLSEIGLNVLNQLKYIKNFNVYEYRNLFSDDSSRRKLINDLYNSLSRFHYLRVLPQKTLSELFPINQYSKQESFYLVKGTSLKLFNEELYELILEYKGKGDEKFNEEEKEKLNYSLTKLIYAGIYTVGKAGKPDSFGAYPIKDEVDITEKIDHNPNCECIDCLIDRYDYSNGLNKIFKYHMSDNTDLWDDLIYAYNLFKIRDFYSCYNAYKKIIIKSNRLGKLEVSFLAKYNLKRLKWAIKNDFYNEKIEWQDILKVKEEIDRIDLDEELEKVKYFVDVDVYRLLKEIRSGVYIQRLCNEIDEIFVKVPKTVENIKNGGSASSSVFTNLYRTVNKLKGFLRNNLLIGNGFSPVEVTLSKSINTFILGYYLKKFANKHSQRFFGVSHIVEFDTFLFRLILEDSKPKETFKFLEKNDISDIKIAKDSQGRILLWINNFLKSSYRIPRHFGNEPRLNKSYINYIQGNDSFFNDLKRTFSSICLVLSYFDFSDAQLKSIYKNINRFIEFVPFNPEDFYCLEKLCVKKHKRLDKESLLDTLSILNNKKFFNNCYNLILESLVKKEKGFKNSEISLDHFTLERNSYKFPIIYKTLPKELKPQFKKMLLEFLDSNKYPQVYYIAIGEKVINTKSIRNSYTNIIKQKLGLESEGGVSDEKWFQFPILQFYDLVYKELISRDRISIKDIKEDKFKFLHSPEKYEVDKFNVMWLEEFNWESFCKKFSKINYIVESLEKTLAERYNDNLAKTYFKIKKFE